MSLARTNYRAGIIRSDTTGLIGTDGLLTISFPVGQGGLANMLAAQVASTPTAFESVGYFVTPTASFSGMVTWVKVWESSGSASGVTVRVLATALTGSV